MGLLGWRHRATTRKVWRESKRRRHAERKETTDPTPRFPWLALEMRDYVPTTPEETDVWRAYVLIWGEIEDPYMRAEIVAKFIRDVDRCKTEAQTREVLAGWLSVR